MYGTVSKFPSIYFLFFSNIKCTKHTFFLKKRQVSFLFFFKITSIILGSLFLLSCSLFSLGPGLSSPFSSHWALSNGEGGLDPASVAVALSFASVAVALVYQTYLSVLVFKAGLLKKNFTFQGV